MNGTMMEKNLDTAMWFHKNGMFHAAIATMTGRYPVEGDGSVSKATAAFGYETQKPREFYASLVV
jgi:hypothetical protein